MRLMIWNIQFFTLQRVSNPTGGTWDEIMENMNIAVHNHDHIVSTATVRDPDVFIMIEPRSQQGTLGSLASGGGPDGLYYLYQSLQIVNNNWSLVPPLKTVNKGTSDNRYTEAVGVFYRSDRLEFIGPWRWPAAVQNNPSRGPAISPAGNPATGPYPAPWNGTMPVNNQNITYAAQFQFFNNNQEVWFPNQDDRRPILTSFREVGVQNPRTFKIFSCHTPPNTNAVTAVTRIAGLAEAAPGNNEVVILAGDFNNDYLSANIMQTAAYNYIRGQENYSQGFGRQANNTNTPTTTKRVNDATPQAYLKRSGLDNIFAKYGAGAAGALANAQIVDRCAGVPNFPSDMSDSLNNILNMMDEDEQLETFRDPINYGHIGNHPGTSDHLAIVVDL